MRVLHVTYQHTADDARILHKQCRSLAEAGYDVSLIAPGPSPKNILNVHHQPLSPRRARRKTKQLRIWFGEIAQYISQIKPGVVHMHDTMSLTAARVWKKRFPPTKFVYDVHEDHPRQIRALTHLSWLRRTAQARLYARLERQARTWIDLFVAATPSIAELYPRERTITVRNLPRLAEFKPARGAGQPNNIIYVGGLTRSRGLIEMIDAVAIMRAHDAHLVLAGRFDGPESERLARVRPGWCRVDHRGWVAHAHVPDLLAEAKIGLVALHPKPNYLDAWPVKLFEYMAAGLPFVASDFPSWRALMKDNTCGLFVDPRSAPAIAEACDYLLQHPEEATRMGMAGRALVERELNWESESRVLLEGYNRLATSAPT